jgi:hypothetical protein
MHALRRSWSARMALCLMVLSLSPFGSVLCNGTEGDARLQHTLGGVCLNCVSEGLECSGCEAECGGDRPVYAADHSCACAEPPINNEAIRGALRLIHTPAASAVSTSIGAVAIPVRACDVLRIVRPPERTALLRPSAPVCLRI